MTEVVARNLIATIMTSISNDSSDMKRRDTIIDIPDGHEGLQNWLESVGFVRKRQFMRMQLGGAGPFALADSCFAIGGPEIG